MANTRTVYQCDRNESHVFTEPGWNPDPESRDTCCPKCGADYMEAQQCEICGAVLPDGETICGCEGWD